MVAGMNDDPFGAEPRRGIDVSHEIGIDGFTDIG